MWEDNIGMYLQEVGWGGRSLTGLMRLRTGKGVELLCPLELDKTRYVY
jgi:hypothetical protein